MAVMVKTEEKYYYEEPKVIFNENIMALKEDEQIYVVWRKFEE